MSEQAKKNSPQEEPGDYPYQYIGKAVIDDNFMVIIRPIRPEDAQRLQETFKKLSPETIYMRFLEAYKELSDKQAHELATVDYLNRMAMVAEAEIDGAMHLIGVARYARIQGEPDVAECAIVVVDDYQGRGLGTILMDRLGNYALDHGVKTFLATTHIANNKIQNFIKKSGLETQKKLLEPGLWEIRVPLEPQKA